MTAPIEFMAFHCFSHGLAPFVRPFALTFFFSDGLKTLNLKRLSGCSWRHRAIFLLRTAPKGLKESRKALAPDLDKGILLKASLGPWPSSPRPVPYIQLARAAQAAQLFLKL